MTNSNYLKVVNGRSKSDSEKMSDMDSEKKITLMRDSNVEVICLSKMCLDILDRVAI